LWSLRFSGQLNWLCFFQVVSEIARVDASMSTFIMVHTSLGMSTIGKQLA
jgi:hypothetical protein